MTDVGPDPRSLPTALSEQEAAALAARYDLDLVAQRPSLGSYIADVWRHRHLMWTMAKGEFYSDHRDNYLGFVWAVVNPLLLGVAYFLIFGLLLQTSRGIDNFITFLTAGLFTYSLFSVALTAGSKSLMTKLSVIRAMQFPRVLPPLVSVLSAFVGQLPAFAVLLVIALWDQGGKVEWTWLLYPVALLIVTTMGLGIAMIAARLVHGARDLANLMPLIVRLLRYVSGVFFSIELQMDRLGAEGIWALILQYQPAAVSLTVVRETIWNAGSFDLVTWAVAVGWALLFFVGGFIFFWRGEGSYGRA
ncbi:ABC transporter permease [Ornithinimicrobium sp. Y1694]|uniref:ABC transporter permease n=1 Tax=Ornithinimicrobium sp. Y1694 TaxID=3418590 RepID=UPI003CEB4AD9